jgi:hypothetical protein
MAFCKNVTYVILNGTESVIVIIYTPMIIIIIMKVKLINTDYFSKLDSPREPKLPHVVDFLITFS